MSQENAKAFFKKIETDAALADTYKALLKEMAAAQADEETVMARAAAFAVENGHDITAKDLSLLAQGMKDELSDEQLDAVAGGGLTWYALTINKRNGDSADCWVIGF